MKPWVQKAINEGRKVPQWMIDRDISEQQFLEALALREQAFPSTCAPTKKKRKS